MPLQPTLPQFSIENVETFPKRLESLLKTNLEKIETILLEAPPYTWETLIEPLNDLDDALAQFWAPFSHMHAVINSPPLRESYKACLPLLSAYEANISQNTTLYFAVKSLIPKNLNATQQKIIEDMVRDFELSGVALSEKDKKRFETIEARLSELSNQYENNVLDATDAYSLHIVDSKRLDGLPEHTIHAAKALAEQKKVSGWMLNLEFPCYLAIITHAKDRQLRQSIYEAYSTRASELGPNASQFDNSKIMDEILALRHEEAQLLGFESYAHLSLATKMAKNPEQVLGFLEDLRTRCFHQASEEFQNLQKFAAIECGITSLEPWDVSFVSEKMRQLHFNISQETLRPYFPLNKVMEGLQAIIKRLFGITMQPMDAETWHESVQCYQLLDETQTLRGYIYVDLFARPKKRGGAWMDSLQNRRKLKDSTQLPIATLTCNFAKTQDNALLSHDEVVTLFHETGHCIHHVLTQVDYLGASGMHGVEWDAVELPSQFLENWCWEYEALKELTAHVETKKPLEPELFDKLTNTKNFLSAMAMLRQLEFSLFDFRMHLEYQGQQPAYIQNILNDVRKNCTVVPIAPYNRTQNSFSHIFAGGYAAGYYSYKWAEVLSSDAFARFEEEGIFNEKTGRDFLHCILEVGGSVKAAAAYQAFRGREAHTDALLRHNGIQ